MEAYRPFGIGEPYCSKTFIIKNFTPALDKAVLADLRDLYDASVQSPKFRSNREYRVDRFSIVVNGKVLCFEGEWDMLLYQKLFRKRDKALPIGLLILALATFICIWRM